MIAAARRIRGAWPRRILYVQYTNPGAYPPLQHSSRLLAARDWEVLFLGIAIPGEDDMHVEPHPRIAVRQLAAGGSGWARRLHYFTYMLWVAAWTLRWRPAWIYASDPIACPAVVLISLMPGLKLLYHEHDSPQRGGARVSSQVMRWARRCIARRARIRVVPNAVRAANFARSIGASQPVPIECVWNCPRRDEIGPARNAHSGTLLRVLYHGSIVPSRLPLRLLEALRDVPVQLQVIGYETQGHLGYVQTLREQAERLGIGDRVRILSGMSRHDLLIASRQSDVGLAFVPSRTDDSNLRWMTGASNKPFDYLAGGLAVLVSDLPDWREMYVDPGYALACNADDPRTVADAFRWLLAHPREMRAMGERGRQRIATDWNYETQFARVLERVTELSQERRAEPVTMR